MSAALALLAAHLLADFPLQSDRMAERKLEDAGVRSEHAAVHGLVTWLLLFPVVAHPHAFFASVVVVPVHFVIDSRVWRPPWAETLPDRLPIAHDQALHVASLWLVAVVALP